jgi:predicted MFS family arabinose efflux permease
MLAYFVHIYASNNALTPTYILLLFIVAVLGAAWTICTLFTWHRSRDNSFFVGFIDLCFVGALIAAVYELRGITHENCTSVSSGNSYQINFGVLGSATINGLHFSANKQCSMLKASFAFGIMNCVFFFITSLLAFSHGNGKKEERTTYVKETHVSRHGHRRSGSHRSHRSSHSRQRSAYV